MDLNIYLIGGAILVVAIIVLNHQRQKNKLHGMLQGSNDTQPIFLMKAVEKKNKALSDILYEGGDKAVVTANATGSKALLIKQLQQLEKQYADKKIALRAYDEQLFDLLEKAKKIPVLA